MSEEKTFQLSVKPITKEFVESFGRLLLSGATHPAKCVFCGHLLMLLDFRGGVNMNYVKETSRGTHFFCSLCVGHFLNVTE